MISFGFVVFPILFYLGSCATIVKPQYGFFDWESTTTNPFDRKRLITWKPSNKNDYTISPIDYGSKSSVMDPEVALIVFLPTGIGIIIWLCKIAICKVLRENSDVSSNTTLHIPPTNRTYPPTRVREPAEIPRPSAPPAFRGREGPELFFATAPPAFSGREGPELSFVNPMLAFPINSSSSNAIQNYNNLPRIDSPLLSPDKPPDYAAVLHSDLSEPDTRFPSVKSKEAESPPPSYNAKKVPKY